MDYSMWDSGSSPGDPFILTSISRTACALDLQASCQDAVSSVCWKLGVQSLQGPFFICIQLLKSAGLEPWSGY